MAEKKKGLWQKLFSPRDKKSSCCNMKIVEVDAGENNKDENKEEKENAEKED